MTLPVCVCLQAAVAAGDFRRTIHKKLIALEERQIDAQRRTAAVRARSSALATDIEAARAIGYQGPVSVLGGVPSLGNAPMPPTKAEQ